MWRVFANCVKFHSHPNNKEAVPSFVSIALHLRGYFNSLWYEYMLPSEMPPNPSSLTRRAFFYRDDERPKRLENSGVLVMSDKFADRTEDMLKKFIRNGGCVDKLDTEPLWGKGTNKPGAEAVVRQLKEMIKVLVAAKELTVEDFVQDLRKAVDQDELADDPPLLARITARIERFIGKLAVPLHEANCRGVTQSSIWGNTATTIWARESSKKPYWPALCLGILPPEDQREAWHVAVTERNEARLPEKLRSQLMSAKMRCELAQKRQVASYFLVEFLGTHEFIWVRETDIVEQFDPDKDPNKIPPEKEMSKKKRAVRGNINSVISSKMYATALEECVWANEEFETALTDAIDYDPEQDEERAEEANYSYQIRQRRQGREKGNVSV
jgi:PWWP domain